MEKDKAARRSKEERIAAVNEAFKRLQLLRNDLMTIMGLDKPVESAKIIAAVNEVKQRASELNANLVLPELPKAKNKVIASEQIPGAITLTERMSAICARIRDFVKNVNLSPSDSKAGLQARRDLISLGEKSDELILTLTTSAAKP